MKKNLLSALLLAFPLLASAYDVEIDGICYNLNPNEQVAEVSYLHYNLGEIMWSFDYRFAPESNSTGEECYAFPQDVWERLKTDTFYVTIKGDYPMIYLNDGWWSCTYTGNSIQPGNQLLADNGDGTWTLTVNFAGEPILDVMDSRHMLFTGGGYYVMDIYFKETVAGDGSEDEQEKTIVWENGTYLSNAANIPEKILYEDVEYTVTSIGARGLCGYKNLASVTIPNSVTAIASSAIEGCRNLTSVVVESGNTKYDSRDNCNAIIETSTNTLVAGCKSTVIPNSVTSIGDFAFRKCGGLTSVDIPNSVTTIGEGAFGCCSGLSSVDIPNSVTSIGIYAFGGCTNLISVTIPNSVTNIGNWAFSSCIQLSSVTIPNSVTSIGDYTFAYCYDLTSVAIPSSVSSIGDYAFTYCTRLTSITIPNSVTSIGSCVFNNCSGLTEIQVESGNTRYDSRNGCNAIIETANNTLLFGCRNTIIPNGVTSIGYCAFGGCAGLTEIIIPNGVTRIGDEAFSQCNNLAIVVIPNSVTNIGSGAFLNTGLKDMYCYAEQVPETGTNIFNSSNYNATLYVPASSVGAYQTVEQWKDFKEIVALPVQDDYRTMVKDGVVWKTGMYGSGNPVRHVEYFYFDGDTIIDGKTCKQMMCQQYYNLDASDDAYISQLSPLSYVGAWYEEDKKVYTYDTISKQFVLMYDFSVDANDTLQINQDDYYVIGPRQTGGLRGFKGVYRDVWFLAEEGNPIYSPFWLEGVGSIDGPTVNVYSGYVDPLRFLMSCTVDDEVIYFNDEYEDGATPEELNANKHRFDFTHTVKTQPKVPSMGGEERQKGVASSDMQSLYGEYSQQLLSIRLDPLDETYVVCITNESNEIVYEKNINTVDIVGLNIDISTYAKGRYTATVENCNESFVGEFEVQATGIEPIINKKEDARTYIYNLQGQRIRFLQKGLNIVNGRKIYVK